MLQSVLNSVFQNFNIHASENRPHSRYIDNRSQESIRVSSPPPATPSYAPPAPSAPRVLFETSTPKVKANDEIYSSEQTLIVDTPSFHSLNNSAQNLLNGVFSVLGQLRFKVSQQNAFGNSHLEGELGIPYGGDSVHHYLHYGLQPILSTRLGVFSSPQALGLEAVQSGLLDHRWTAVGRCSLTNPTHDLEVQLASNFELDNLHLAGGLDYSQTKAEDNRYHYDLLARHKNFFLGYAWVGTLLQTETCNEFAHENKFSLGWTGRDYLVNFTSSANLSHHSFHLYHIINSRFDHGVCIGLDQNKNEVSTELAVRWKLEPRAERSLTVKIGNSRVGVGFETRIHEQIKFTGAACVSTTEPKIDLGLGFELEI